MSDLTPAQRIEAAIVRLEELKGAGTPGLWSIDEIPETGECRIIRYLDFSGWQHEVVTGGGSDKADADLIVTLHATIDAQIGLLREALYQLTDGTNGTGMLGKEHNLIVRLADAIISGGTE